MSSVVDILDQLESVIVSALPTVTVDRRAIGVENLPPDVFPSMVLLYTEMDPEPLSWGQIRRTWEISCTYYRRDETPDRDRITQDLESIMTALRVDPTLGQTVYQSFVDGGIPFTHPDERTAMGTFEFRAEGVF